MKCPECNSEDFGVTNTLYGDRNTIYRLRKCKVCGTKIRTVETIDNGSQEFADGYAAATRRKEHKRILKEK